MLIGTSKGLPGEFLLLFTILIWLLFFLIYFGNRRNKLNCWCFISGMCFSMGVFKEYLYFTFFPYLIENFPKWMNEALSLEIYSVLTAVSYYLAMPTAMVFGFYFSRLDERRPRFFRWARLLVFVPALVFGIFYPYTQTRQFQLYDRTYYLCAALYNWLYGALLTAMLVGTLRRERGTAVYRQKLMASVLVLAPTWYVLVSTFLIHLLGLKGLFKAWQGNLVVVLALIVFYLYNAFKGGFMGARFKHESFGWNKEEKLVNQSAQFLQHMLKNEVAKMEWCAQNIEQTAPGEPAEFAEIILRSTARLKGFATKALDYSRDIVLSPQPLCVAPFLRECAEEFGRLSPGIAVEIHCGQADELLCDRAHLTEVMDNLLGNAGEAVHGQGRVAVEGKRLARGRGYEITVSDTGAGIPEDELPQLFAPYYTTKAGNQHMGLGLYYCRNVMLKHGGHIEARRNRERGMTFALCFPEARILDKEVRR